MQKMAVRTDVSQNIILLVVSIQVKYVCVLAESS